MFLTSSSLTIWLPSVSRSRLIRVAPAASSQSAAERPEITASISDPDSTSSSIRASASTDRVSIAAAVSLKSRLLR